MRRLAGSAALLRMLVAGCAALIALPAASQPVVIDFEEFQGMDYNSGQPIPEFARLSDELAAVYGVVFSSGADYVAVGAIFGTASKEVTRPASIERLREVKAAVRVPVVAIGGIDADNISSVVAAGADAAAVISAVCGADDPRAAAARLAAAFAR